MLLSANVLSVRKSSAGRDSQCPSFQSGKIFCINIQQLRPCSNLNYKLDKKSSAGICVAGAALWDACYSFVWQALGFGSTMAVLRGPAMQLTCNTHATHSQHNTQHEHFSCKFSIKVRVVCQNLIFAFKDRILGQPLEIRTFIENLQEKCSCCVLC